MPFPSAQASTRLPMLVLAVCFGVIGVLEFVDGNLLGGSAALVYAASVGTTLWQAPARGTALHRVLIGVQLAAVVAFLASVFLD